MRKQEYYGILSVVCITAIAISYPLLQINIESMTPSELLHKGYINLGEYNKMIETERGNKILDKISYGDDWWEFEYVYENGNKEYTVQFGLTHENIEQMRIDYSGFEQEYRECYGSCNVPEHTFGWIDFGITWATMDQEEREDIIRDTVKDETRCEQIVFEIMEREKDVKNNAYYVDDFFIEMQGLYEKQYEQYCLETPIDIPNCSWNFQYCYWYGMELETR